MQIIDVKKLEKDDVIKGLQVVVKKVFDAELKENYAKTGNDWKQHVVLSDDTGEIYGQLSVPEADTKKLFPKELEGKSVVLSAYHSKKHGFIGCKANVYKNKDGVDVHQVKMTGTCEIRVLDENSINIPKEAEKPLNEAKTALKPIMATNPKDEMWENKEKRQYRGMTLSYAKDLCVADKVKIDEVLNTAEKYYNYVYGTAEKNLKSKEQLIDFINFYLNSGMVLPDGMDYFFEKKSVEELQALLTDMDKNPDKYRKVAEKNIEDIPF